MPARGRLSAVALHAIYKWFPDQKRTIPTAILSQGAAVGVIVALPLLNLIIVKDPLALGVRRVGDRRPDLGRVLVHRRPRGAQSPHPPLADGSAERVGYGWILLAPTFIGCVLACFGAYWGLSSRSTWFTPFVVKALGYQQSSAGSIATLPWVMGACTVMLSGWISKRLVGHGVRTRIARGVLGTVPLIAGGMLLLLVPSVQPAAKIALLVLGGGLTGPIYVVLRR